MLVGTACVFRDQLTSLLLRWTDAADTGGHPDSDTGKDNQPLEGVATSSPAAAAAAPAEETAGLVAAGLKLVKTVCTKAENNKGQCNAETKVRATLIMATEVAKRLT